MSLPLRFQVLTLPGRPWPEFREQVLHIEELGVAAGFTDLGIYYPTDAGHVEAFDRIATTVVPSLRVESAEQASR